MKSGDGVKSFLIILIIGILTYIAIAGINIPGLDVDVKNVGENIKYGIDISGGIRATLVAPEGLTPTDDELNAAKSIIEARLDNKQIYDRMVVIDRTARRIVIEIPWAKGETNFDPQAALDDIGQTALLTFQEVDEDMRDEFTGEYFPTGRIVVEGNDVSEARPAIGERGRSEVALKLTSEASRRFEEATGRLVGQPIAIFLDDQFISAPTVNARIPAGTEARISFGNMFPEDTVKEANRLAGLISSGALPFSLEAREVDSVSPKLGQSALDISVQAGIIALLLIWLFMILYYRLPGILSCIALLGQVIALVLIIAASGIPLTLPGIAGIILTIGMSVDANVIIFERIKEELKAGKTVKAAIDSGFRRAVTAVLDGNITTLIAASVLFMFGTGPIQSFAFTLGIGVVLNFITAILITRILLRTIAGMGSAKKLWLYGVKGGTANV
ncbi:UNVERIFIED_CONTAM: preprotein translocase subunit SecD [Acetivibrio alkalicellulosi]